MKILIIPKVIKRYKNQFEYSVEVKLFKLIKKIFGACDIEIMNEPIIKKKNYNLIILSGGNTILNFSKKSEDVIRSKLDNIAFKHAKKYKTKILGICHGAHFMASKNGAKFKIDRNHIAKRHDVLINQKEIFEVNSFHKLKIVKINKSVHVEGYAYDKSIEYFVIKKKQIGIIWHPEREENYYKQIKLMKKILWN